MNEKDKKVILAAQHEAARLELAMAVPSAVLSPVVADIMRRGDDDVICIINAAEETCTPDLAQSLLAVVKREVLAQALGNSVPQLEKPRVGHIPFVVVDRYGTTVVQIAKPTQTNAPGGSA